MNHLPTVRMEIDVPLTVEAAADFFTRLSSTEQRDFFVAVAEQANGWPVNGEMQWCCIGQELARESTPEAKHMIRCFASFMESYLEKPNG